MTYRPPPHVMLVNGQPIPRDMDFFCEPPASIGKVMWAYSSLKTSERMLGQGRKAFVALVWLLAPPGLVAAGMYIASKLHPKQIDSFAFWGLTIMALLIGFVLCLLVVVFGGLQRRCYFIGERGIARAHANESTGRIGIPETLAFQDASDLYVHEEDLYVSGVYSGTQIHYTWKDLHQHTLFEIRDRDRPNTVETDPGSVIYFARSAQTAWSDFKASDLKAQMAKDGIVRFKVNRSDYVAVGPGFFEFSFGATVQILNRDQIASVSLENGHFSVKSVDAKWYSGKGKFSFEYSRMANARLFLWTTQQFVGIQFTK
jgi:hypothetical protein